jgi:hypothetical protein
MEAETLAHVDRREQPDGRAAGCVLQADLMRTEPANCVEGGWYFDRVAFMLEGLTGREGVAPAMATTPCVSATGGGYCHIRMLLRL